MICFAAAHDKNFLLADKLQIPWQGEMPADVKRYHSLIAGKTIVMGYNTWLSMGSKPMPRCKNAVLTEPDIQVDGADLTLHSLDEVYALEQPDEELIIIGGGNVFKQMIDRVDRMYITIIHHAFKGNVFFPKYDVNDWEIVERQDYAHDAENKYDYTFLTLDRPTG